MGVDRSGRVKFETLEYIFFLQLNKDWVSVDDVQEKEEKHTRDKPDRMKVSMRLLRYKRQGLLIRRKIAGRLTEYKLSKKGEDRLKYLMKKLNLLAPPLWWEYMGNKGRNVKEMADIRAWIYKKIEENQIERVIKNQPLRTPKLKPIILKLDSTLKENEEQQTRMRAYPLKN